MSPSFRTAVWSVLCLFAFSQIPPATAQESETAQNRELSLHDAIKIALEESPYLGAAVERNLGAREETISAQAAPNPELSLEAENIAGDGAYDGLDGAEITYGVSQLIEMPGKRSGRTEIARSEERKSLYERDAARLDLIRDVVIAYAEVVSAEEDLKILEEEQKLSRSVFESVAAKVDAGKEPPIQKNKAQIALSTSEIALESAKRRLQTARKGLSNLIGGFGDSFLVAPHSMPAMKQPPDIAEYAVLIQKSPDKLRYDAEIQKAQSALSLEKSNVMPDPTINVGVRDFRENDDRAFVAGISFPLPVFNMNRGKVRKAGYDYNTAMLEKRNAALSDETRLAVSYESLCNAYRENQVLRDTILTGAQEAFSAAREGYKAGKFSYLDVLDAQRTLFEARKQYSRTKLDYYRELATIDRLAAIHAQTNKKESK